MAGTWFAAGMAGVNYLLNRHVRVPLAPNVFAYACTVLGVALLFVSTVIGGLHPGWYFLYPLPFHAKVAESGPVLFLLSLTVLAAGWLVWALAMLASILKRYPLRRALSWHHLAGGKEPATPPFILITTVTLIGVLASLFAGVLVVALFAVEYFTKGAVTNDALLMKNLTFIFGHTLVNEMLYLGIALLYELFPGFAGRPPYKTVWYVALAWNATLLIVLFAYFHHLYMDFVQPVGFQFLGQIASWFAPLPAASVTMFTVLATVYKSRMQWSLPPSLFFFGVLFWAVGGIGAILDAVIANNFVLHNTQWVPAHFHTYNLLGSVLFGLAFVSWFATAVSGEPEKRGTAKAVLALFFTGGAGFLLMFYLGGAFSVLRRMNTYPEIMSIGVPLAKIAAAFAGLYILGLLVYIGDVGKRCVRALFS
jgi:cytochrome c oxidase subunit 1